MNCLSLETTICIANSHMSKGNGMKEEEIEKKNQDEIIWKHLKQNLYTFLKIDKFNKSKLHKLLMLCVWKREILNENLFADL